MAAVLCFVSLTELLCVMKKQNQQILI